MTCAVLAVPDVSRVGGGAQAPRAAVPIPDTLTFLRVCLRSVLFSPGPGMAPPPGGMCYSRGSVERPLQSRSGMAPPPGTGTCYSRGSVALVCFVAGKCWLSSQLGPTSDSWALFPA